MVQKVYKKLTAEQRGRGVVYSSTLSNCREETTEDTTHEIKREEYDAGTFDEHRARLTDDRFFDGYKKYNIIRS